MLGANIAIVEDDPHLANTLVKILASAGYCPHLIPFYGETSLQDLTEFDLIILDVGLPGISGLDLAKRIRRTSSVPIIVISGSGTPKVGVAALRSGGDDFVKKPFDIDELVERINALLRRSGSHGRRSEHREIGEWQFDASSQCLRNSRTAATLDLTERESDILRMLLNPPGSCVSRERVARIVCGRDWDPLDRSIDVHVSNLRKKLRAGNVAQIRISSVRNRGYLAVVSSSEASRRRDGGEQQPALR